MCLCVANLVLCVHDKTLGGCLRMGCSGVTKWGEKLHKDELHGVYLSSRKIRSYCEGWDGQDKQNGYGEREIRDSCLVCLWCVAQSDLQNSQHDAFCRRLTCWKCMCDGMLIETNAPPSPHQVGCRVTGSSTLQFQLPVVTFHAQRLYVSVVYLSSTSSLST